MTDILNRAIEAFDLSSYVVAHGGREVQTNEWLLTCPMCFKPKLTVELNRRAWHCWVCEQYGAANFKTGKRQIIKGAGGLVDLVQLLERWDRKRAAEYILKKANLKPENLARIDVELQQTVIKELSILRPTTSISYPAYAKALDGILPYMVQRGISMSDVRTFGLFVCTGGRYQERLIFPVYEEGRLVYYQGRAMWESKAPGFLKALNPSREEGAAVSSEVLFNLHQACKYPRVTIVEGPIDAVHVGASAVCTFGKKISAMQIAKLLRAGVRALNLMWDGPAMDNEACARCFGRGCSICYGTGRNEPYGAWPEMFAVAPTLSMLFDTRLVFLPRGDPGSWGKEVNAYYIAQARPVAQFSQIARI